jgi:hypothetical protein
MNTKIGTFDFKNLHNEEHFQFENDFIDLINQFTPAALGIEAKYSVYLQFYAKESEALSLIRLSSISDELPDADQKRIDTFIGLSLAVKSAGNHFNSILKTAATHLQILFEYYSSLPSRSYEDKTEVIYSLIGDLNGIYQQDITNLGLADWICELEANNNAFVSLKNTRYSQEAGKIQLQMKHVRLEVDNAYRNVVDHINALITIQGGIAFKEFVCKINQQIQNYSSVIAKRKAVLNSSIISSPSSSVQNSSSL